MKKGIIVLLIAVLVSGFAFAGFSGYAGIQLNANLDKEEYGFANKKSATFTFEFAADTKELTGEKVYGELKATAKAIVDEIGGGASAKWEFDDEPGAIGYYPDETTFILPVYSTFDEKNTKYGLGLVISIDTAKIVGDGWFVDILGVKSSYDYAKAAVATAYQDKVKNAFDLQKRKDDKYAPAGMLKWKESASSYSVAYDKAPGVAFGYAGFTASVGFEKVAAGTAFSATIETPEFAFSDDAVKIQIAAEASKVAGSGFANAGASAKTTVAIQDITFGVAADFGVEGIGDEATFDMDARVDFKYSFVDVNVYTYIGKTGLAYGGNEYSGYVDDANPSLKYYRDFYLEAKAVFDLNAFELPLKVTAKAKNITNTTEVGMDFGLAVDYAKDALAAGVGFDINFQTKEWSASAKAKYDFEQFTVGAGLKFEGKEEIKAIKLGVFAETDKLVQNVRLGLGYGLDAGKLMEKGGWTAIGDGKYSSDFKAETAGVISAYAIIKF